MASRLTIVSLDKVMRGTKMTILCTYVPWSSLAGNRDNIIWFITKVVSINDIDSQYHVNTEAKKWL